MKNLSSMFKVTEEKIKLTINSLIQTYKPLYIYAFGSYAQNNLDKNSDFDVLVVIDKYDDARWKVTARGYAGFWEINMPIDLIVYDKAWFESCKTNNKTFCYSIVKKGKLMYARNSF